MDNATINKIKSIFSNVIGIDPSRITDELEYGTLTEWDSLKHLKMVSEFETEFNIDIDMDDIIDMGTFKKIVTILDKYIKDK